MPSRTANSQRTAQNDKAGQSVAVVVGRNAPELERFAANELCSYLEKLFGIQTRPTTTLPRATETLLLIGNELTNDAIKRATAQQPFPHISDQGIVLRRAELNDKPALLVGGGSPRATLWAVYELVERWGVRYLTDRDILPEKTVFRLPDLDVVMEPKFRVRSHPTIQDFAASGESWGIGDFAPLFDQLAKLKFTRIHIGIYGWQPYLHWACKGIERKSASFWYDYHYHISPDMVGRELFDDRTEFWNPDFPLTADYSQLVEAGERLLHNLMAHAHSRGLECNISAPLADFPQEFAPLLTGCERSHVLGGMTVVPGPKTPLDDPELFDLASTVLHAIVNTYPEVDMVTVAMPEYRQWTKEYKRAWRTLDDKYGVEEVLPLDAAVAAAKARPGYEGEPLRALTELKGDIASLYFYERLLRHGDPLKETRRPDVRFNYWGPAEELYPILDRILPHDWEMEVMPSNFPSVLLERVEVLKTLPAQIAGVMCLTIDDDNIGVLPQLTTNSLHAIVNVMKRHGWSGMMARERFPGDHDWPLNYLARAAWDDEVTPDEVARDLIDAICGEACVKDLLTAFHEIEAATIALSVTNIAFPADWPPVTDESHGGMMLKHWREGPPLEPAVTAHRAYKRGLNAARRAQQKTQPAGRWYTDFWVGRLEFAVRFLESTMLVHRAALAHKAGDRPAYLKHADAALTALHQSLEAYAPIARNQTDRGAIATVHEHCYRPLKQRSWSLHAHGY